MAAFLCLHSEHLKKPSMSKEMKPRFKTTEKGNTE